MANTKDFFLSVTQRVFSNWTALRMAVEHGMGSKDRAIEFCPYITEVLYMNENLSSDDLAAELEEYMDTEFQTELQDNSAIQVAEQLLKFHRYCIDGNEAMALTEMEKLPSLQPWILSREAIRRHTNHSLPTNDESNSDTEEETDNTMDTATANDDWVEVRTRRKK